MNDATPSYGELSSQTASKLIDVAADASHRAIRYSRSIWNIVSLPYSSMRVRTIVAESFDRASEVASVSARAAKAQIDATQSVNEMLLDQAMQMQDAYLNTLRGVLDVTFSNLSFVREAATVDVEEIARRYDDYTPHRDGASVN